MDLCLSKLQRNPKDIYQEATRLLIKIADNILQDPSNQKLRTLQKANQTISSKILDVYGGKDCLTFMGFQEGDSSMILPTEVSLDRLKEAKEHISKNQVQSVTNGAIQKTKVQKQPRREYELPGEMIQRVVLPPHQREYANHFLNSIAFHFHLAQIHDNKDLHERARKLIPIPHFEINAQQNLRDLQEKVKKGELKDLEITIQDLLILELLDWFRNDFFVWVDTPDCANCDGQTKFAHMSTDPNMLRYTNRVEMYTCQSCNALTPFPRYNDLDILMATRRGRCGEWANCFTLFCRAMGWDARHVFDETDHVWTEVYSVGKKRWLHCDPCENVCDTPLMYEAGWNKHVSYVIAYSGEEVQDVTWRYTSKHKEVLTRRQKCTEEELLRTLIDLRTKRQKNLSESRRKYLAKRLLEELCELMVEKQPTDNEKNGRNSGSLGWRVARGEQQITRDFAPYVWKFCNEHLESPMNIRYYCALNCYELSSETKFFSKLDEWHKGISEISGIFRKEEKDWKMVYLARTENSAIGKIAWEFGVDDAKKAFDTVDVFFDYALYENGVVEISIVGDSGSVTFPPGEKRVKIHQLSGSKKVKIIVTLSGGKGNVAWQHAQLFRQATSDSTDYNFDVTFTFKDL